jgi:hypothetical protein
MAEDERQAAGNGRTMTQPTTTARPTIAVVIHHLEQARGALAAAAEAACAVELRSAPGAAAYAGIGYLKALGEAAGHELLIDCGEDPGTAMAALRAGCRRLSFSGAAEVARRLVDMAEQLGAVLVLETTASDVLELAPEDNAAAVVRARLQREGTPGNKG